MSRVRDCLVVWKATRKLRSIDLSQQIFTSRLKFLLHFSSQTQNVFWVLRFNFTLSCVWRSGRDQSYQQRSTNPVFLCNFSCLRVVVGLAIDSFIRRLDIENIFRWNAREVKLEGCEWNSRGASHESNFKFSMMLLGIEWLRRWQNSHMFKIIDGYDQRVGFQVIRSGTGFSLKYEWRYLARKREWFPCNVDIIDF
jgi:hypothetical protein